MVTAVTMADRRYADSLPIGLFHCDDAGVCHFLNRRARELLADTIAGTAAPRWLDWFEDAGGVAAAWARARATATALTAPFLLGTTPALWLELTVAPARDGGYVGTLVPAAPPLNRFFATVGHELRQPLHAAGLFLGVLELAEQPPRQRELIDLVAQSLKSLEGMLGNLVALSRLDAGMMRPAFEPTDLGLVVERLRAEFAPLARTRGLDFRLYPRRIIAGRRRVRSDPLLLGTMLAPLIGNALTFTSRGGVLLGCRDRGRSIWFEVWDTGCGIAPDQQSRIFEPFFRIESGAATQSPERRGGLGLGIAIVAALSRLLDHPVSVCSMPGRGTLVRVKLPVISTG
ncbi:MAG: HAMP domain-containing sensor histidine kinase [Azospirillaceae bacterium]|nr:HAMP domain-containing sensor histidine kinase [Azospirillaceae bacterium]